MTRTPARGAGLRALAGLFAGLSSLFILAGVAALGLPPSWLPWRPLQADDPPNALTRWKLSRLGADVAACETFLRDAGVRFTRAPERTEGEFCSVKDAVVMTGGGPPLRPAGAAMRCQVAAGLVLWHRHGLLPAARAAGEGAPTAIRHLGTYSCRRMYGRADGPASEHAFANAIDVQAFDFPDGTRFSLPGGWTGEAGATPESAAFLEAAQKSACEFFNVVLGPRANAAHRDHFHFDMGRWRSCR